MNEDRDNRPQGDNGVDPQGPEQTPPTEPGRELPPAEAPQETPPTEPGRELPPTDVPSELPPTEPPVEAPPVEPPAPGAPAELPPAEAPAELSPGEMPVEAAAPTVGIVDEPQPAPRKRRRGLIVAGVVVGVLLLVAIVGLIVNLATGGAITRLFMGEKYSFYRAQKTWSESLAAGATDVAKGFTTSSARDRGEGFKLEVEVNGLGQAVVSQAAVRDGDKTIVDMNVDITSMYMYIKAHLLSTIDRGENPVHEHNLLFTDGRSLSFRSGQEDQINPFLQHPAFLRVMTAVATLRGMEFDESVAKEDRETLAAMFRDFERIIYDNSPQPTRVKGPDLELNHGASPDAWDLRLTDIDLARMVERFAERLLEKQEYIDAVLRILQQANSNQSLKMFSSLVNEEMPVDEAQLALLEESIAEQKKVVVKALEDLKEGLAKEELSGQNGLEIRAWVRGQKIVGHDVHVFDGATSTPVFRLVNDRGRFEFGFGPQLAYIYASGQLEEKDGAYTGSIEFWNGAQYGPFAGLSYQQPASATQAQPLWRIDLEQFKLERFGEGRLPQGNVELLMPLGTFKAVMAIDDGAWSVQLQQEGMNFASMRYELMKDLKKEDLSSVDESLRYPIESQDVFLEP